MLKRYIFIVFIAAHALSFQKAWCGVAKKVAAKPPVELQALPPSEEPGVPSKTLVIKGLSRGSAFELTPTDESEKIMFLKMRDSYQPEVQAMSF